jgi:uncharacterized protein YdhG (YjbR/CyaY superfamily)
VTVTEVGDDLEMDQAAQEYIDAIPPEHRALFDRMHGLVLEVHPDAEVGISYGIPTYKVGKRRLYVGVWKHGISLYGWGEGEDAGFAARHPELSSGKGTLRITPAAAGDITDDELRALVTGSLSG